MKHLTKSVVSCTIASSVTEWGLFWVSIFLLLVLFMNIYSSSLTWVADYQFIPGLKAADSKRKWKYGPVLFKKELFRQVDYNLQSWYLKAVE